MIAPFYSSKSMPFSQSDIFSTDEQHPQFAELCNALYEREIFSLANECTDNVARLQRRLRSLTHHIRSAARYLVNHTAPMQVDFHNASWQAKQSATAPSKRDKTDKTEHWYLQYAHLGMPVPVSIQSIGIEHVELDSIDRLDLPQHRLHLNKHGWFTLGDLIERPHDSIKQLLIPNKGNIMSACAGHCWNYRGRIQPRTISLRELLLSSKVNWKNFKQPVHSR